MSLRDDDIKMIKEKFKKDAFDRVANSVRKMPFSSDPDDTETQNERRVLRAEYYDKLKEYLSRLREDVLREWLADKNPENSNVKNILVDLNEYFDEVEDSALNSFDNSTK